MAHRQATYVSSGVGIGSGAVTSNRIVRISDAVWSAAKARAEVEGSSISDVVRRLLATYARLDPDEAIHGPAKPAWKRKA
ncbi:hypothetical protein [Nocardioides jensenii]|uniref:hypothetical protein n=1 Tax=Nocardioides jensenii TaxID=1843 RepID=UPI00082D5623|nr:hypothetical protein [Nocardioides jensenii]